jgi:ubiquinone biosynthesis protein
MLQTRLGRNTVNAVRLGEVLQVFIKHGFADIFERIGVSQNLPARMLRSMKLVRPPEGDTSTLGERLCNAFTELGPSFVKFGQVMSTRPDVLGESLARDLSALQDRVEPLPFEEMRTVIESQLDAPLEALYAAFDPTPVASASLSQVYRATLHSGESVAVKVMRPGIERRIESDLSLMRQIAEWAMEVLEEAQIVDPPGIVDEFARSIRRELDFTIEARVTDQFRENFVDVDFVQVPRVFHSHSAKHVLTLEWIDGVRVDQVDAYEERESDPAEVAENGCDALCQMVFNHHLFHADPHPGNVFLTRQNRLAFIDLGMAGHLERSDVVAMADLFLAIFNKEPGACVDAILTLAMADEVEDREKLEHEIAEFIAFEAQIIVNSGEVSKGLERAVQILHRHHLRLAPRFSLLLKGLATIEIVGRSLSPDLDFIPILEPYVRRLIMERYQPQFLFEDAQQNMMSLYKLMRQAPGDATALLQQMRNGKMTMRLKHEQAAQMMQTADRASSRLSMAIVLAALVIGGSIAATASTRIHAFGASAFVVATLVAAGYVASIIWTRKY